MQCATTPHCTSYIQGQCTCNACETGWQPVAGSCVAVQAALQIEPSVAVQGVSSLFLFRARLASQPPAGSQVLLHLSPSAEAVGDLVGMMYDDGDFFTLFVLLF